VAMRESRSLESPTFSGALCGKMSARTGADARATASAVAQMRDRMEKPPGRRLEKRLMGCERIEASARHGGGVDFLEAYAGRLGAVEIDVDVVAIRVPDVDLHAVRPRH